MRIRKNNKPSTPVEHLASVVQSGNIGVPQFDNIVEVSELPKQGWHGTALPTTDYIDKLYFNTELSVEETINILKNLKDKLYTPPFFTFGDLLELNLTVCYDNGVVFDKTYSVFYSAHYNTWIIGNYSALGLLVDSGFTYENPQILFCSNPIVDFGITLKGWDKSIQMPINYNNIPFDGIDDEHKEEYTLIFKKLSSIISTTPFVEYELPKDVGEKIYKVKDTKEVIEFKGTALPADSTVVENLYFNQNLSVEETVSILKKANLPFFKKQAETIDIELNICYINFPTTGDWHESEIIYMIVYVPFYDCWAIGNTIALNNLYNPTTEGYILFFLSKPLPELGLTLEGWDKSIKQPIVYNNPIIYEHLGEVLITLQGALPPFEKLSSLISSTPFETITNVVPTGTYLYYAYNGKEFVRLDDSVDPSKKEVVINKTINSVSNSITFTQEELDIIMQHDGAKIIISDTNTKMVFIKTSTISNGIVYGATFACVSNFLADICYFSISNLEMTITLNHSNYVSSNIDFSSGHNLETSAGYGINLAYRFGGQSVHRSIALDEEPTKDSFNPITSDGVYKAIGDINSILDAINGEEV